MQIGSKRFEIGRRTFVVGIVNVTPDSFFDGGSYTTVEGAVLRAKKIAADGADIIEIGGESSRPGFTPVAADVELGRVIPVLQALKKEIELPIAVDTYKAEVAQAALQNGASLINDIFGFKKDPELAKVCARLGAACCVMHNRDNTDYGNFLLDVIADLQEGANILISAGVSPQNIILDPGIGFAKSAAQNLEVIRNLPMFSALPYPVMLGTSRKSFIGKTLGLPTEERLEATLATSVLAVSAGCAFVRVHDVLENKRAVMMADEIIRHRH